MFRRKLRLKGPLGRLVFVAIDMTNFKRNMEYFVREIRGLKELDPLQTGAAVFLRSDVLLSVIRPLRVKAIEWAHHPNDAPDYNFPSGTKLEHKQICFS